MKEKIREIINLVKDYTKYPGGRFIKNGPWSGEKFRDDFLLPALDQHEVITINMDGASCYSPSFIDEVFGKICKKIGREAFERRIIINLNDDPDALDFLQESLKDHSK